MESLCAASASVVEEGSPPGPSPSLQRVRHELLRDLDDAAEPPSRLVRHRGELIVVVRLDVRQNEAPHARARRDGPGLARRRVDAEAPAITVGERRLVDQRVGTPREGHDRVARLRVGRVDDAARARVRADGEVGHGAVLHGRGPHDERTELEGVGGHGSRRSAWGSKSASGRFVLTSTERTVNSISSLPPTNSSCRYGKKKPPGRGRCSENARSSVVGPVGSVSRGTNVTKRMTPY